MNEKMKINITCNTIDELMNAIHWAHQRNREWGAKKEETGWSFNVEVNDLDPDHSTLRKVIIGKMSEQ